jgi:hypothetical protein
LGAVGSITVNNSGAGYLKAPLVTLKPAVGDPGKGATADSMLAGDTIIGMKNITEGFEPTFGRMNVQLGTTAVPLDFTTPAPQVPGIAMYIDPPSDYFNDGQVQVFRLAHLGVDSHIAHFHLMNLQVINRVDVTNTMYPPLPNELGWKESIRTNPFTDLILAAQPRSMWLPFAIPRSIRLMDPTAPLGSTANYIQPAAVAGQPNAAGISNVMTDYGWEYVWHCHLLGHEENDMMRPIVFNPAPPLPPTNLTAAFTSSTGNIVLKWTAPASGNTFTYQIQRATSTAFTTVTTFTVSGTPLATTYTDNVAATGAATYYYRVASIGQGTSAWSNIATVPVAPIITSITPNSGARGFAVGVTIAGSYLTGPGGATTVGVSGNGMTVATTAATATSVTATFTIAATATANIRSVTVAVPGAPASNAVNFSVLGPTLTAIAPSSALRGAVVPITLTGTILTGATAVTVSGTGVTASNVVVVSATQLTASLTIAATAAAGNRTVTVTTPGGITNAVTFTVLAPTLTVIAPTSGALGATVPITLTGTNLTGATAVTVSGTGVAATAPVVAVSGTSLTSTLTIAALTAIGARSITVTTPAGTTNAVTFTVKGATVSWAGPNPALNKNNLTTKIGTITVTNSSTAATGGPLTLSAATLTVTAGAANGTFTITGGTCTAGAVLNPRGTCTIIVQYVPINTTQATAYVTLTDTGAGTATQSSPTFNAR